MKKYICDVCHREFHSGIIRNCPHPTASIKGIKENFNCVIDPAICIQGSVIGREVENGPNGKGVTEDVTAPEKKHKTDNQIIKWLKKPYSDSAEYKMWGNGVALPCVFFVLAGIAYYYDK